MKEYPKPSNKKEYEYQKPIVWYAVLPHYEATSFVNGASTYGEACEMLYEFRAQGFEEAYILLTIRL